MDSFKHNWCRLLTAITLSALLLPNYGQAAPQDEPRQGDSERRRVRDGDARERTERGERERGARPTERDILREQLEILRKALPALKEAKRGDAVELLERAIRASEVTLEGRRDDAARAIRERAPNRDQLSDVLDTAAGLWREFGNSANAEIVGDLAELLSAPRDGDAEPDERRRMQRDLEEGEQSEDRRPETLRDRLRARLGDLRGVRESGQVEAEVEQLGQRLGGLLRQAGGDSQNGQLAELKSEIRELRGEMREMRRSLDEIRRLLRALMEPVDDEDEEDDD